MGTPTAPLFQQDDEEGGEPLNDENDTEVEDVEEEEESGRAWRGTRFLPREIMGVEKKAVEDGMGNAE